MTTQLYLQKAELQLSRGLEEKHWKACWQLFPVRMGTSSAKSRPAVFWVNTGLSTNSMLGQRNSLAGSPIRRSIWNMTMMTCSMRKSGKPMCYWELCRNLD